MKYIWEESDLRSDKKTTGIAIESPGNPEMSILGFMVFDPENRFTITSLRDGMVCNIGTISQAVEFLNNHNYGPVMNHVDVQALVKQRKSY